MSKDPRSYIESFKKTDRMGSIFEPTIVSLSSEECIYEYEVNPAHYNPNGILHGGALYTIMDSSQGMFVHFLLNDLDPLFKAAATGTATIKYLAPLRSGKVRIRTWLKEKQGRKIFVNSTATDESGKEVAALEEIWIGILG